MTAKTNLPYAKLKAVLSEVRASYTKEELMAFPTFQAFFDNEDVRNAYEENWEAEKETWRPYLEVAFQIVRSTYY